MKSVAPVKTGMSSTYSHHLYLFFGPFGLLILKILCFMLCLNIGDN